MISWPMLWLSPDAAEPAEKHTIASRKSGLRPNWSPSFPATSTTIVEVSR